MCVTEESLLAKLAYPLNIYASILAKEIGFPHHLHYGHFSHSDESIESAQVRAVELLSSHLPSGIRILEVGCGFGTLTQILLSSGYAVTGITPDPIQIAIAKLRYGSDFPVSCLKLEDFAEEEGGWDLLLFHESGQYVPMLDLLERASTLLKVDGQILILDEFAFQRAEVGFEPLHYKDHFLALASRFGFVCLCDNDYTKAVIPTLDFLISSLEKYATELADETGVDIDTLRELILSNENYREKYKNGRFGYSLLHLQRKSSPPKRLARITATDQEAVSDLFEKVFAQPLSPEMWTWKYGPGRGQAIGLWEDETLVAHYGGIPRKLNIAGSLMVASQSCDVMVAPHVRGALVRKGPFFQVCATFLEHFVGYGTDQPLAFGFPNERAFRLPRKLGLYTDPITRIHELTWQASDCKKRLWAIRPIDATNPDDILIIDNLWQQMASCLRLLAVGVRNADYLRERYQNHPQHNYKLFLVCRRWLRKPLAIVVVNIDGDRLELLDWVSDTKNIPKMIMAARTLAAEKQLAEVYTLASLPVCEFFAETDVCEKDINITVPENAWTDSSGKEILQNKLWLTGGDTDFR